MLVRSDQWMCSMGEFQSVLISRSAWVLFRSLMLLGVYRFFGLAIKSSPHTPFFGLAIKSSPFSKTIFL